MKSLHIQHIRHVVVVGIALVTMTAVDAARSEGKTSPTSPVAGASVAPDASSLRAQVGPTKKERARAAAERLREKKANTALRRAYQKEFAYLVAEKRALQNQLRLAEQAARATATTRATEQALLEGRVMAATRSADAAEDFFAKKTRAEEAQQDTDAALQSIREQAATSAGLPPTAELGAAFGRVIAQIGQKSLRHESNGRFYNREGIEVIGTVVDIGGVARFGVADNGAGALAPAGDGAWKVWPQSGSDQARALASGTAPSTLSVFLAAKTDAAISPPKAKTPLSIVRAGGTVAWVIVGLGVLGVLLALARLFVLFVLSRGRRDLEEVVLDLVQRGQIQAAMDLVHQAPGSLARVLRAALDNLAREANERVDLVDERLLREQARADWFASALIVVAAVAPLLGLLGTVTGMISTFDAITEVGTGDPKTLAGGISEALITTELGLIVAIPTLLLGNLLSGLGGRLKQRLEIASLAIHNRIEDQRLPPSASSSVTAEQSVVAPPNVVVHPRKPSPAPGAIGHDDMPPVRTLLVGG